MRFDLYGGEIQAVEGSKSLFRPTPPVNPIEPVSYRTVSSKPIPQSRPLNNKFDELIGTEDDGVGTQAGNEQGGSLWGTYDERAERNAFQEAVKAWRNGDNLTSEEPSTPITPITPDTPGVMKYQPNPSQQGGLLWGEYNEEENSRYFQEAVMNYRIGGKKPFQKLESSEMEIQAGEKAQQQSMPTLSEQFTQHLKECVKMTYFDRLEMLRSV